ncbi:interleukin-34 isoform X1 [Carettochelys insculpta]|uniref:interleukin-34 isoform X1 n=1 Tax=Carettochelys insculpta TaxID=44489 RepID=UPI003EBCA12D
MQRGCAPVLCVLAVLGLQSAVQEECTIVRALRGKLAYQQRLQYTRHYFPINYTVNVHFHEVLRAANVSSLRARNASEPALRYLWLQVNSQVLRKIGEVLLEEHPSWEYTRDLRRLLEQLEEEYESYNQGNVDPAVWEIVEEVLAADAGSSRKAVRPKALLDNCARVMWLLYSQLCH